MQQFIFFFNMWFMLQLGKRMVNSLRRESQMWNCTVKDYKFSDSYFFVYESSACLVLYWYPVFCSYCFENERYLCSCSMCAGEPSWNLRGQLPQQWEILPSCCAVSGLGWGKAFPLRAESTFTSALFTVRKKYTC